MPHSVTISGGSTISFNFAYLKTMPAIIKITQLVFGAICVGIVGAFFGQTNYLYGTADLFFLLMTVTFLTTTFILLISSLVTLGSGDVISKTAFEFNYHVFATILLLASSITFLVRITEGYYDAYYDAYMTASIFGLINSSLYLCGTFFAIFTIRGV